MPEDHCRGYKGGYGITYYLDLAPPNQPEAPWITDQGDGRVYKTGETCYTSYHPVPLEWTPAQDNPSTYDSRQVKSGIKEYIIYINGLQQTETYTTNQCSLTSLTPGESKIKLQARDKAGNLGPTGNEVTIFVDQTAPSIPGQPSTPNQNGYTSAANLTWSWDEAMDASPGSGLKGYKVYVAKSDGTVIADWITVAGNNYTHETEDGITYTCKIKAIDKVGNESYESLSDTVTADRGVDPVTFSNYPLRYNNGTITFNWNPIPDVSGIERYEVALTENTQEPDAARIMPISSAWKYDFKNLSAKKSYYAWVRGVDKPGNIGPWQRVGPSPDFIFTGPAETSNQLTQKFTVTSITGQELAFRVWYMNPGDGGSTEYSSLNPATVTIPEGEWDWWLEIYEVVNGRIEIDSMQITEKFRLQIDTTNPPAETNSFVIKSRTGEKTYDAENAPANTRLVSITNLNLNDNPGGSGIKGIHLWNGTSTTPPADAIYKPIGELPAALDWTLADGPDGIRDVNLQITDNAGNTTLVTYRVKLDTSAPAVPDNLNHTVSDDKIIFNWKAPKTEPLTFSGTYTLPGGSEEPFNVAAISGETTYTGTLEIPATGLGPNEPVTLKLRSVDQAGNESPEITHTAYTQAALGTLQALESGYDLHLRQHYLKWQLTQTTGTATGFLLEYGSRSGEGFTVQGTITADPAGILTHTGLTPHGTYQYRPVALNGSGDRTEGETFERQVPNVAPTEPELIFPAEFAPGEFEFQYQPAIDHDGDLISYHIYLKGGSYSNFTEVTGTTALNLEDGRLYYWYLIADDNGINGQTNSRTGQFTVDKNAPVLTVEQPYRPYSNQKQLVVTVSDNLSGVAKVTYQKIAAAGNEVLAEGTITLTTIDQTTMTGHIGLEEGQYHLHLTAYDQAGNSRPLEQNNLKIDQTPPQLSQVSLDLARDGGLYLSGNGKLPVTFQADDSFAGVKWLRYWIIADGEAEPGAGTLLPLSAGLRQYASTLELNGESGKQYHLAMAVEDQAGNRSAVTSQGPVLLDQTPPRLNLTLTGGKHHGANRYTFNLAALSLTTSVDDPESGILRQGISIIDAATGEPYAAAGQWEILQGTPLVAGNKYRIIVEATNKAGLQAQTASEDFIFDDTEPEKLTVTGPETVLASGEQAVFNISAGEPESAIAEYRLALVSTATGEKITALVPGNQDGWLSQKISATATQFRIELPAVPDGTYYPVAEAYNAAGLKNATSGKAFSINNTMEKVIAGDQGPYTMFNDRLTGWWRYTGAKTPLSYKYRIVNQENQVVLDWQTTTGTMVTATGLTLVNGEQYRFEVQAGFSDGTHSESGYSPGVTVDNTQPEITGLGTPEYTTSNNLTFHWSGRDDESGLGRVQLALGSDYYQTDVTGGWIDITGNTLTLTRQADGEPLHLTTGARCYLTLRVTNGAGLAAEKAAPGIIIDDTPPPVPVLIDQGAFINPAKQPLEANWLWTPVDPESGPVTYKWALLKYGRELSGAAWNEAGRQTKATFNNPGELTDGATYYFVVQAVNQAGLTSTGYSDGIVIDQTAPVIPKVTLLQAINLGQKEEAVYITNTNNLELEIQTYDLSGIQAYEYTYGTRTEVEQNPLETSPVPVFPVNPDLTEGEITVFKSECSDGATNISQPGYSSGVVLDTGAPKITNVRGGVTGHSLYCDWEVEPSTSPVAFYEVALVPEAQMNNTPAAWTKTGLTRSIFLDGKDLADGNYRLLVRGCNQAGTYSRRQGELNEWGISPRITVDRRPPEVKELKYDQYVNRQLQVEIAAADETSGIGGYQYALGTKANPFQYTNGWVDRTETNGWIQVPVPTAQISHGAEVYLMARAKDQVGLWSAAKTSGRIIIDHTAPTTPEITSGAYATDKNEITGISYHSNDPESGLTHYRLGLAPAKGEPWLHVQEAPVNQFNGKLTGLTLEEAGQYYLAMQTRNGAGDWSETGYSQAITVDTVQPELIFSQGDRTIVINQPPVAIEYTLTEPALVELTLTAVDGSAKQFTREGTTGTNLFIFEESLPQVYTLTAKPLDPAGNPGPEQTQLIRVNAPPRLTLTEFYTRPGAPLQFRAAVIDPDGQPVTYRWNPGDGGGGLTGISPEYRYTRLGEYTVTLTVTDNDGGVTIAATKTIVQNTVTGNLWMNETWSGTHHLYGDVIVPAGITLTIEPGTEIIVSENCSLIVQGALNARGGKFSALNGTTGGWNGIYIEGTADITGVIIENAVRGITATEPAQVTIEGCTFRENQAGLHVYGSKPIVTNSSFLENTIYGIKEDQGGRPVVKDCRFSGNGMDYYHETLTEITIEELNRMPGNGGNR